MKSQWHKTERSAGNRAAWLKKNMIYSPQYFCAAVSRKLSFLQHDHRAALFIYFAQLGLAASVATSACSFHAPSTLPQGTNCEKKYAQEREREAYARNGTHLRGLISIIAAGQCRTQKVLATAFLRFSHTMRQAQSPLCQHGN
jgi:hypothetical protein